MIVIHAENIEAWCSPPPYVRELKVLLSPSFQDVSKDLSIGIVTISPGQSGDPHIHDDAQEAWYVISGKGELIVGDEKAELIPDTLVVAPAGVEHQIINDSNEPLKVMFVFSPAGPEESIMPRK